MLTVRDRAWWGASAPLGPPMRLPVSELWLHHSVTPLTDDPVADMRVIERVGVQRFGRFSYSWAYHRPTRSLLEGAGNTIGAHTSGRNSISLGLVLIGNYDQMDLDDEGVADLREAVAWLVAGNRLRPGVYPTGGHRDLKETACPGGLAYARLDDIRRAAPLQEDPFMALSDAEQQEILAAVRQTVWPPGTPREGQHRLWDLMLWTLAAVKAGRVDVDEDALATALAPLITSSLGQLSDEDVERVAEAVADEQARRLGG